MNLRMVVHEWAAHWALAPEQRARLNVMAGFDDDLPQVATWVPRVLALAAAALFGFGLICWVAANWGVLTRAAQFTLLQALVLLFSGLSLFKPTWRVPTALAAFVSMGGLFAYFGMTYQTGADPWQLFAIWSLVGLPLVVWVRSEAVWAPWSLVAMTAVGLWAGDFQWDVSDTLAWYTVRGWLLALLVLALLSPLLRSRTGAGIWSFGLAVLLWVVAVTVSSVQGLLGDAPVVAWTGLAALVTVGALMTRLPRRELLNSAWVVLGVAVWVAVGVLKWFFTSVEPSLLRVTSVGSLVVLSAIGASVRYLMWLWQRQSAREVQP